MATKDPRIDTYIAEAPEFARPILKHLRKLIHQGCPQAVETIKWGSPFFDYHGLLCGLAAFKAHCSMFFWRDIDIGGLLPKTNTAGAGMGQFGKLTSLADLPSDTVLLTCIRRAGIEAQARKPTREGNARSFRFKKGAVSECQGRENIRSFCAESSP